jgi:hypothetical protein
MTDFRAELTALPDDDVFTSSTLVDPFRLRHYIDGFLGGRHNDSGTIWRLYAIAVWARVYAVRGV